jgi:hypothetical protein
MTSQRVVGRKRHVLVDKDGRLLLAIVSPADLHDSHALLRPGFEPQTESCSPACQSVMVARDP